MLPDKIRLTLDVSELQMLDQYLITALETKPDNREFNKKLRMMLLKKLRRRVYSKLLFPKKENKISIPAEEALALHQWWLNDDGAIGFLNATSYTVQMIVSDIDQKFI